MVAEPLQQPQQPPHQHHPSAASVFASTAANSSSNSSSPSLSPITGVGGSVVSGQIDLRLAGRGSPGHEALMQWIEESGGRNACVVAGGGPGMAALTQQQQKGTSSFSLGLMPTMLMPPPQSALGADGGAAARCQLQHQPHHQDKDALDALMNATAIKNAVRLQPRGYRPGVMGGRVGLLEGLRTADMDKYDEVSQIDRR